MVVSLEGQRYRPSNHTSASPTRQVNLDAPRLANVFAKHLVADMHQHGKVPSIT